MEKKRIAWVDTAKFICMIAVMADHAESSREMLDLFVAPFYLNMFSFAAGYVYVHREGFGPFFRKKLRQLFIPWLVFSLFVIFTAHLLSFRSHAQPLAVDLLRNFLQIHYFGDEMWYVAALFVAFVPFYFVVSRYERSRAPEKTALRLLLFFLLLALGSTAFSYLLPRDLLPWSGGLPLTLPWHLEYIGQAVFYMLLGYFFRVRWEPAFDKRDCLGRGLGLLLLYLVLLYAVPPLFGGFSQTQLAFYYFPCSLAAIPAMISLCKAVTPGRFVSFVGQNTLVYYGLHGKVESLLLMLLRRFVPQLYYTAIWGESALFNTVFTLAFALIAAVLLLIPAVIVNRWFPFVLGRRRKARQPASR